METELQKAIRLDDQHPAGHGGPWWPGEDFIRFSNEQDGDALGRVPLSGKSFPDEVTVIVSNMDGSVVRTIEEQRRMIARHLAKHPYSRVTPEELLPADCRIETYSLREDERRSRFFSKRKPHYERAGSFEAVLALEGDDRYVLVGPELVRGRRVTGDADVSLWQSRVAKIDALAQRFSQLVELLSEDCVDATLRGTREAVALALVDARRLATVGETLAPGYTGESSGSLELSTGESADSAQLEIDETARGLLESLSGYEAVLLKALASVGRVHLRISEARPESSLELEAAEGSALAVDLIDALGVSPAR